MRVTLKDVKHEVAQYEVTDRDAKNVELTRRYLSPGAKAARKRIVNAQLAKAKKELGIDLNKLTRHVRVK